MEIGFEDKFVAFIDILGFKNMVKAAEDGDSLSLAEIFERMDILGNDAGRIAIQKNGPQVCPQSPRVRDDLSFEVTQISDCAIVSAEISPAGAIAVVNHCWNAVYQLMLKGVLVRGYITRGRIIHRDDRLLGSGYQDAYSKEAGVIAFRQEADEKGTPFVEVDDSVISFIAEHSDERVKKVFARLVESDGKVTAVYPFKRLTHSYFIGGNGFPAFDPENERRANNDLRNNIKSLINQMMHSVDFANKSAHEKTLRYVEALKRQIEACDRTDENISILAGPSSSS